MEWLTYFELIVQSLFITNVFSTFVLDHTLVKYRFPLWGVLIQHSSTLTPRHYKANKLNSILQIIGHLYLSYV